MGDVTLWLLAALASTFLWAMSNVLDAALRRHFIKDDVTITWMAGLLDLPFIFFFVWWGGLEFPSPFVTAMIFLAGALWVLPEILYFRAIETEDASRIALLIQLMPISTLLIAYFILGETLNFFQGIAFIILIIGGTLAALKRRLGGLRLSKSLILIAFASILWSLSDVLFKKFEMAFFNFEAAFSIYFISSFVASLALFLYSKRKKRAEPHVVKMNQRGWWMLIATVICGNLGSLAFAYALTLKEASLTAVIVGVQPLIVLIFGFLLSPFIKEIKREPLNKDDLILKGFSFIFIFLGIVLLQF